MKTSFNGFNEQVASFEAASGVAEGKVVGISANGKVQERKKRYRSSSAHRLCESALYWRSVCRLSENIRDYRKQGRC